MAARPSGVVRGGTGLCRDCDAQLSAPAACCPICGSGRLLRHAELFTLHIAHVDADAFYASVEKAHRPELRGSAVIVGGGRRGVVTAACYVARMAGVRSAMPMFQALALCPDAQVIAPDFPRYREAAHRLRALMAHLTPLVQALSIDEAVLDLAGTEALHGVPPAIVLAGLARKVEVQLGITISIGLAANRLMAKIAAGRDKPRGFAVIGTEAATFLADQPVRLLPGVGAAAARALAAQGIVRLGQLQALDNTAARRRLGQEGPALVARARGQDARPVDPRRLTVSISAETTLAEDVADIAGLQVKLWHLAEKLAARLAAENFATQGVVLKLKTADFRQRTRQIVLPAPTRLPDLLFEAASRLLLAEADGTKFRLIGIGTRQLVAAHLADQGDLADPETPRRAARQAAIDALRQRFGASAVQRGRGFVSVTPKP